MAGVDAYLKAFAALVCLSFGLIALADRGRRASHRWLAFFLFLIAGNQVAETLRAFAPDEQAALLWFRVATVFAALDPVALYLFAFHALRRAGSGGSWAVAVVASTGAGLALAAGYSGPQPDSYDFGALLAGFTVVVYTAALGWALLRLREEPQHPAWRLMVPALALAALPTWVQLIDYALYAWGPRMDRPSLLQLGLYTLGYAGALVVGMRAVRGVESARRVVGRAFTATMLVVLFLSLYRLNMAAVELGVAQEWPQLVLAGVVGTPIRWLGFGALLSVVVLRHDGLGMSLRARRTAARVLVGLVVLVAAAGVLSVLQTVPAVAELGFGRTGVVVFVALLALSQGFRTTLDRVARSVYGVPMPTDISGRHETYRIAAAAVAAQGRPLPGSEELARLRGELDLDETSARAIERVVEASTPAPLAPGALVAGRYRVLRLLGRGGGGRAFLVRDEALRREVVLKEVEHQDGQDEALREARLAGAIADPHVVAVHDVLPRPGASLVVQEYVPGGTLHERLAASGPYDLARGLHLVEGILQGLAAVHAAGIVHGDVKPANVLLTAEGTPRLGDFGIATLRHGQTMRLGHAEIFRGTVGHMAPEQSAGERPTPASDVYAVALLARRVLPAPLPPEIERELERAGRHDPAERFATAGEMLEAFRAARAAHAPQ